ncbi:hypothetical protein IV493_07300 [Pantoea sp. SM3640]|uniref:hypothetical protein n=1 Tax=Pantoea sp. SM3640 TaxID=2787629 RepID=UPI0018A74D2F|nr:hypothetical protein [Pantoea sp. SM3640]QPG28611.1 hypothetical protein IV493_07300 [Pantoea sp. SM3640]
MKYLSEHDELYAKLEVYLENIVFKHNSNQFMKEDAILKGFNEDVGTNEALSKLEITDLIRSKLNDRISDVVELPTKFDDRLSFGIASELMSKVGVVSKLFPFNHENYAGFCCVPTGKVSALAVPVKNENESKVFVVFESGLFQFISGVFSIFVNSMPKDLLKGGDKKEWHKVWHDFLVDAENKDTLLEFSDDLKNWRHFFDHYNVDGSLAYSSAHSFGENGYKIYSDMLRGCELFIAAHEYSHAMLKHQNGDLDPVEVEKEADTWGIRLASLIFDIEDININLAICGIALFFSAIDSNSPSHYLPSSERINYVIEALNFEDSNISNLMHDLAELIQKMYEDVINYRVLI